MRCWWYIYSISMAVATDGDPHKDEKLKLNAEAAYPKYSTDEVIL